MTYTSCTHIGSVTVQRIEPIDPQIVRARFSVQVPGYWENFSDTLFDAYGHLALKGTRKHTDDAIDAYVRTHGLVLGVSAADGLVNFTLTAEAAQFGRGIALVQELVHDTLFRDSHVRETVRLLREENREAYDDAKVLTEIAFMNALYPKSSSFSMRTLSEELADIRVLTKSRLTALHAACKRGEWLISVAANEQTASLIYPFVQSLSRTATPVTQSYEHTNVRSATSEFVTVPGKSNVEVRIGSALPVYGSDDDVVPFLFGLAVLGKVGGFSGRLMSTVREKEGLTYGIYARAENLSRTTQGHWNIITFFTARDLVRGIAATKREIQKIVKSGITQAELVTFKEILKNQFVIAHESNARRIAFYHSVLLSGDTEADVLVANNRMANLSKKDVHTALRKFIDPEHLVIAGAGPVTPDGEGILSK